MRPEILAPVGGEEQLLAAVRCGADAVYFGLKNFNARRNADNFEGERLHSAIKYCHEREVKVYITVNTLVMDKELTAAERAIDEAVSAGADGLIIQDLALASYARGKIAMSASTQLAVHNVSGAKLAAELGFKRVVLARELSFDEISKIASCVDIECEVFVHGAMCVSASGNCYMSSLFGQRSGNRGLCAQPCRLDWSCDGRSRALSLKDLSYIKNIKKLGEAGVSSLKIEGRMKRPEYVAAAVSSVKAALSGEQPDMEILRAVFSRQGFSDGYFCGRRDKTMFGYRTKEDVVAAEPVLKDLAKLYENESYFRELDMHFIMRAEQPARLIAESRGKKIEISGAVPEKAVKRALDEGLVRRSLEKTGGTVYKLRALSCDMDGGLTLSSAELNRMRREALDALSI